MQTMMQVQERLASLIGKSCAAKWIGEYKSLTIGFGKEIPRPNPRNSSATGHEWELGTYTSAWRIVNDTRVLCGSMDPVDDSRELDDKLQALALGAISGIEMVSPFDIRVIFTGQTYVDFMCASGDDDETFHIFGADNFFAAYSLAQGWTIRK